MVNTSSGTLQPNPDPPLVSVIVPAYNAERYVEEALQSVFEQDYSRIEVLLVDDGSKDDTVNVVRRSFPDTRILTQKNAGAAAARNTGLRNARGEFICFLDADDGWFPGKLAAQVSHLSAHPEVGAVFHAWLVRAANSDGTYEPIQTESISAPVEIDPTNSGWIYTRLLLDSIIHTSTPMIRRTVSDQVGLFNTTLVNGEDYDYWLRLSRVTRVDMLAGAYSFYRATPGSLTTRVKPVNYEYEVLVSAIDRWGREGPDGSVLPPAALRRRLGALAFDFSYAQLRRGSGKLARASALQALKHDPKRFKAVLLYLASFLPSGYVRT